MWDGKLKAITLSFDDGVTQDIRAIEIINKYNLKATFNLNSALFGAHNTLKGSQGDIRHNKVEASDIKEIYAGHEVAVHTLSHPLLPKMDKKGIIWQVEKDREILSELCGYEVIGMAYPCGGVNNDERVAAIIKENTGVKYSRTITSTYNFDLQDDYYRFNPTIHIIDSKVFETVERFINLKTDKPQLLYIWGHAYEFDDSVCDWKKFEELCKMLSGKEDIFYGTNKEVLF